MTTSRDDVDTNPEADHIEESIDQTRSRVTDVLDELDRRRHRAFDVKGQVLAHKQAIGLSLLAAGLVGTGVLVYRARRRRQLARWFSWEGLRRNLPVHVQVGSPVPQRSIAGGIFKVVLAAAAGAAPLVGKTVAKRLLDRRREAHAF